MDGGGGVFFRRGAGQGDGAAGGGLLEDLAADALYGSVPVQK